MTVTRVSPYVRRPPDVRARTAPHALTRTSPHVREHAHFSAESIPLLNLERDVCVQRPFATGGFGCFCFLGCFVSFKVLTRLHVCTHDMFERDIADNVVKQVDWTQEFYPCTLSSRTIVTL
jgi:hypothetical protein